MLIEEDKIFHPTPPIINPPNDKGIRVCDFSMIKDQQKKKKERKRMTGERRRRGCVKRFGQAKSRGSSALLTLFVNLQDY